MNRPQTERARRSRSCRKRQMPTAAALQATSPLGSRQTIVSSTLGERAPSARWVRAVIVSMSVGKVKYLTPTRYQRSYLSLHSPALMSVHSHSYAFTPTTPLTIDICDFSPHLTTILPALILHARPGPIQLHWGRLHPGQAIHHDPQAPAGRVVLEPKITT